MKRAKIPDHIVMHFGRGIILQCRRCGQTFDPKLPQPIGALLALSNWFSGEHSGCRLSDRGLACTYCDEFGHHPQDCPKLSPKTPQEWFDGPDTGVSSKAIWHVMMETAAPRETRLPQDPDDFGRCYRLLRAFPAWRNRLAEVADKLPAWAPLVREWDALSSLWEQESPSGECPKLYAILWALQQEGKP